MHLFLRRNDDITSNAQHPLLIKGSGINLSIIEPVGGAKAA